MDTPHRVEVFTCGEVLIAIYGEEGLAQTPVEEATKAFAKWLEEKEAFYLLVQDVTDPLTIMKAVLNAIAVGKDAVVLASLPPEDRGDDGGCGGCDDCQD